MAQEIVENLVIGGGPAGSMAGLRLAEAGRPVVLLEKERGPHPKVCGEFLSREAVEYLGQAGVDLAGLGAVPIDRVRLSAGGAMVEAPLGFRAMSLSRRVLDEAMLRRAQEQGCEVRRGAAAEALTREGVLWRVTLHGAEPVWARTVFLATGKHDVRGWARGKARQMDLVGFKCHWRLRRAQIEALRGAMELFLFPGGYGGLSLVEGDTADFCFVIRRGRLMTMGGWSNLLDNLRRWNPRIRERLDGAEALSERPLAIAPIPYGYLAQENRGVWCVGDQAAVIPSFTGDGMSIALHSASVAVRMALAGGSIAEFNRTLHAQLRRGMGVATLLSEVMVTGAGRRLTPMALRVIPSAMRWIALVTRIPEHAMVGGRQASDGSEREAALPA
jgi:flavin-dependent dehydrogenase